MAASDYLNEMRRYFENNSRTKDFVAHTAKVCKDKLLHIVYLVIFGTEICCLLGEFAVKLVEIRSVGLSFGACF